MQRVLIDQDTLNAIGFLLDYNWADELADYETQLEGGSTDLDSHHIFARMVEVDNWLRSLNGDDRMTPLQHTQIGKTK
jgi:hypothetical protein